MDYKKIITVEIACEQNGSILSDILPYNKPDEELTSKQKWLNDCSLLDEVFRAVNGGKEVDWTNNKEEKWFPLFYSNGSAFVFTFSLCIYGRAHSALGSRFATLSREQSDFIGKAFPELYCRVLCFKL